MSLHAARPFERRPSPLSRARMEASRPDPRPSLARPGISRRERENEKATPRTTHHDAGARRAWPRHQTAAVSDATLAPFPLHPQHAYTHTLNGAAPPHTQPPPPPHARSPGTQGHRPAGEAAPPRRTGRACRPPTPATTGVGGWPPARRLSCAGGDPPSSLVAAYFRRTASSVPSRPARWRPPAPPPLSPPQKPPRARGKGRHSRRPIPSACGFG